MPKIVHAFYWVVITALLIALWFSPNSDPILETPVETIRDVERELKVTTNSNQRPSVDASQLAAIEAENALLKEQLATALRQLSEADEKTDLRLPRNRNGNMETTAETLARVAREQNLETIDITNLDQRLLEEPVDYNWAYEMDMKFRDFLLNSNSLSNVQLENINCRTQVCAFEMSMINEGDDFNTMGFHREFSQAEGFSREDYMYLTMHESGTGAVRLILEKRPTSD